MSQPDSDLVARSISAVKWNYLGVAIRVISQLIVQISLARLLGPDVFGIFAIAFLMVGFGSMLVEMGLGSALIQKKDLHDDDVTHAVILVLLASLITAVVIWSLSDILATFFGNLQVAAVVRAMTPVLVIQGLTVVPLALLKRQLEFRTIQIIQLGAYITGYVIVGIGCALFGAGVWSLVAAVTATSLIVFASTYAKTQPSLAPMKPQRISCLLKFGTTVTLTNIANWLIENVDKFLVGKLFGAGILGLYSVSYNLVRTPANHLVASLQAVLFPASSLAQDNSEIIRRGFLVAASAVALTAFPCFAVVASVSHTVIFALFGNRWINAAGVLLPLALAMACHAIMAVAGPILWGIGRPDAEMKIQLIVAVIMIAVLLSAGQYSIEALAWSVFALYGLRAIGIAAVLCRSVDIPWRQLRHALGGGIFLAIALSALVKGEDHLLRQAGAIAVPRLVIEVFSCGLAWFGLLMAAPSRLLSPDLVRIIQRLVEGVHFPGRSPLLRRIQTAVRNAPA